MSEPAFSEAAYSLAWMAHWQAKTLAGAHRVFRRRSPLSVPPDWTAWLLMDKAGVPRALIAYCGNAAPERVTRCLRLAKALMIFAPYAARVESLAAQMPRFALDAHAEPTAPEVLCAGS